MTLGNPYVKTAANAETQFNQAQLAAALRQLVAAVQ